MVYSVYSVYNLPFPQEGLHRSKAKHFTLLLLEDKVLHSVLNITLLIFIFKFKKYDFIEYEKWKVTCSIMNLIF